MNGNEEKQARRTSTAPVNKRTRAEKVSLKPNQKQMEKSIDATVMPVLSGVSPPGRDELLLFISF